MVVTMTKEQHIWEQLELEDYIQERIRQELLGYPETLDPAVQWNIRTRRLELAGTEYFE